MKVLTKTDSSDAIFPLSWSMISGFSKFPLLVKKGFIVFQKFLLVTTPFFVVLVVFNASSTQRHNYFFVSYIRLHFLRKDFCSVSFSAYLFYKFLSKAICLQKVHDYLSKSLLSEERADSQPSKIDSSEKYNFHLDQSKTNLNLFISNLEEN